MAEYGYQVSETFKAAADLREAVYHIMRFVAAGTPPTTNIASEAAGSFPVGMIGVLQNKPNTGQAATVAYFGKSKVVAGGGCTAGEFLTTNGSGRAVDASDGDQVFGRALDTVSNDGEVISCLLYPPFKPSDVT
jgi:hypothetical protein